MSGTVLTPNTSYHPQIDGQMEVVNKWLEGYLRNYVSEQQRAWVKWLHIGEYYYNFSFHMSIKMSPFLALYGYEAPSFVDLVFGESKAPQAKDLLQQSQDIMKSLKDNLQIAQNQVIRKVGVVAYELELPSDSRVHNVFHVSRLKKALGHNVVASSQLPPLDEEGQLVLIPEEILDFKECSLRKRTIREYLVKWKNLPMEDATWESDEILQHPGHD
ncbi:uncharacterized protein LOC131067364 [Cryptomeria japonica]|uniref:uncharacterized protein LOC131067364 n=1 Tax=Cryptomeria japonica TaxID=3369 RepID=UPI0025AC0877|nr:uncharacterized protein LOC131067364 [Cryptomeria japonica]